MNKYKSILINLGAFYVSLLVYLLFVTMFSKFEWLSYESISVLSFCFIIFMFFISGFSLGRKSLKRGFLSGIVIGVIFSFSMFLLGLVFSSFPNFNTLLYYLILILSSTLGGMFGINFKKK